MAEQALESWPEDALLAAFPTSPRGISMAPLGLSRGNEARSHDACWGEDRAHTQSVCDLPAAGQRLAHTLSVLVLFRRQELPPKSFPRGERGVLEAAILGTAGGFFRPLYLWSWPH